MSECLISHCASLKLNLDFLTVMKALKRNIFTWHLFLPWFNSKDEPELHQDCNQSSKSGTKEIRSSNKDIDMSLIEKNEVSHLKCHYLTHLLRKQDVSCHNHNITSYKLNSQWMLRWGCKQEVKRYPIQCIKDLNYNHEQITIMVNIWWWWWWWIVFVVWLTNKRRLSLFPAETIVRNPHHLESPTCRKQDLNLRRTWVEALLNEVVQKLSGH